MSDYDVKRIESLFSLKNDKQLLCSNNKYAM